jgi:HD-like signal output (HDOD) protein
LNRLLVKLSCEDVRFGEVSELIEKDTAMAGSLLRVVNSALYGLSGTINSVRHGLSIVGIEKARNIVLTMSVARFWQQAPPVRCWSSSKFNLHSTATATMSDILVQHVDADYPEGAFTAGLFHDLGKLLSALALPEDFSEAWRSISSGEDRFEHCEMERYGLTHAELSAAAMEHWNLPRPIAEAVRFHHSPGPGRDGHPSLSAVVRAADRLVNRMDLGLAVSEPGDEATAEDILAELGLRDQAARLLDEFRSEFEMTQALF